VDVLEDKKAESIVLLDLRPDTTIADFFVVANGTSDRQLGALMDYIRQEVKDKYGVLPFSVEGVSDSGWVLLDFSDVVVHLFLENTRSFYDLEGLWDQASVMVSIQ
jgi:ribosome-associated protein